MVLKHCKKCQRLLPIDSFYKDRSKKDGRSTCCIDCRKQWKRDNKERLSKYNRAYGHAHKEEARERKRRNRQARIEHYRKLRRDWAKKNPERNREHKLIDYQKHKEKYIQRASLRRVREKSLRANFTLEHWEYVLRLFNYECAYCGAKPKKLHQEHIIPVVRYGEYTLGNIIPACPRCNLSKHDRDLMEWYPTQPFFSAERLSRIAEYASKHANQSGRLGIKA